MQHSLSNQMRQLLLVVCTFQLAVGQQQQPQPTLWHDVTGSVALPGAQICFYGISLDEVSLMIINAWACMLHMHDNLD